MITRSKSIVREGCDKHVVIEVTVVKTMLLWVINTNSFYYR